MSLDISKEANSGSKNKEWMKKHPILTGVIIVFIVTMIGSMFSGPSDDTSKKESQSVTTQPQTFEGRIKALAVRTGTTDITYNGIDDEKADSNRPAGSRMITVKLNVTNYYSPDSLYKNTGELTAKILKETFSSNPNVYDVIVWYYAEITDKYGNKENKVLISQAIDKTTYQKINWQNFDSTKMCEFLKSEGSKNGGETTCVALATIK